MAQWFWIWMITWVWESYSQDGCRVCSQLTTNEIVWKIRRSVWRCNTAIWVFAPFRYVDEIWIHHNAPDTNSSQNSGFLRANRRRRRPRCVCQSINPWLPFSRIHVVQFTCIAFKREEQSMVNIMPTYLTDLIMIWRKNDLIWPRQKVLSHQGNARVQTCLVSMVKFHELGCELLPHPLYSPDLAPSDYVLF